MMKWKVKKNGALADLVVKRSGFFKPREVWLSDEKIGNWPGVTELRKGVTLESKAGDKLELKMTTFPAELKATFNGEIVGGTAADPETAIKSAYKLMCFICGLNLLLGFFVVVTKNETLMGIGFGMYNVILGAIHFCLLTFGYREKILWPLAAGFAIFTIDAAFMIYTMILLKTFSVGPIIVRIMLLRPWAKGCIALYRKKSLPLPSLR